MSALGIIFSNIHDQIVPELTRGRTMASIPFGGRYRLIDFVLSPMVGAGMETIGVITKTNYQSLMNHVGRGRDWDLDRKSGGLMVLPPFGHTENNALYNNRLEALKGVLGIMRKSHEKYVVMSDCDIIANFDLAAAMKDHEESGADITMVYKKTILNGESRRMNKIMQLDENNRVIDLAVYQGGQGEVNLGMDVLIIDRTKLISIVEDAIAHGYSSMSREIMAPNLDRMYIRGYEHKGYYCFIDSIESYMQGNLDLLDREVRKELFDCEDRPIFTKVKDSPPTKYGANAEVKNSMIADGCTIEGTVENSILFRGVKVGRGAVVRNSVLMQDVMAGENSELNYVVADKRVVVKDGRKLSGYITHPFFINKDSLI